MSPDRAEMGSWVMRWAQQAGASRRAVDAGWDATFAGGGSIAIRFREGKFAAFAEATKEMRNRSPEQLLHWQFENAAVVSFTAPPASQLRMGVVLPLDGLVENHLTASLDVLAGRQGERLPVNDEADQRRNLAAVKQWWEREHGSMSLREWKGGLSLRFRRRQTYSNGEWNGRDSRLFQSRQWPRDFAVGRSSGTRNADRSAYACALEQDERAHCRAASNQPLRQQRTARHLRPGSQGQGPD